MVTSSLSTIAQVLCHQSLPMNFARLVGEVDGFLENELDQPMKARWDRETTVCFDLPGSRVVMDWTENPGYGLAGVLTLTVGPAPHDGARHVRPAYHALCKKLVNLVETRVTSSGVLWRQLGCEMSSDWMELLVEALPDLSDLVPPEDATNHRRPVLRDSQVLRLPDPPQVHSIVANQEPCLQSLRDPDLVRIRSALYETETEPQMSKPMRLAVHAMNATLIMVWTPLGAVALAHGVLKGEDMRLASHLMVLTGLGSAVSQTPLGQQILAMLPLL